MATPIGNFIRGTIDTLQHVATHVKNTFSSGLGSAHQATTNLFAGKDAAPKIPAPPIHAETFATEKFQHISLHPKAEQDLKNEYTQGFSHLLNIENGTASIEEKGIYSLILEIMDTFNPQSLSPLAIIHFREALNAQLSKLERILSGSLSPEEKARETKKQKTHFKKMEEQLIKLKDILSPENKHRVKSYISPLETEKLIYSENTTEDEIFTQTITELALVIAFTYEGTNHTDQA